MFRAHHDSVYNHTFKAACFLRRDIGLSIEEAMPYFLEWNKINSPPWTENELRKKLIGAMRARAFKSCFCFLS